MSEKTKGKTNQPHFIEEVVGFALESDKTADLRRKIDQRIKRFTAKALEFYLAVFSIGAAQIKLEIERRRNKRAARKDGQADEK
jgi:hypothetical protein